MANVKTSVHLLLLSSLALRPAAGQACAEGDLLLTEPVLSALLAERLTRESAPFPGTVLAISIAGLGTWKGAAGYADLEAQRPMQPADRFRIASITKTFVAAVVLQLDQEGALDIEDPLDTWLPGPFDGKGVTLRHLLGHQSGIYDYYQHALQPDPGVTTEEVVATAAAQPLLFTPGSDFSYSNTNYVLLGLVIEKATRSPWHVEVQDRLLERLGLADTSIAGVEFPPGDRVRGYDRGGGAFVDVTESINPAHCGAAADMVSSARDLLRWTEALFGGEVLDPDRLEAMMRVTPGSVASGLAPIGPYVNAYGLGLYIEDDPGTGSGYGHSGYLTGAVSILLHYPDVGLSLVMMANAVDGEGYYLADISIAAALAAREYCAAAGCPVLDHDRNGIADACEIAAGASLDCNQNGIPDAADLGSAAPAFESLEYDTGGEPAVLTAADLDGDGDLDLAAGVGVATSGSSAYVSLLLNESGAFSAPLLNPLSSRAFRIAAGDLDGDGDVDLVLLVGESILRPKDLVVLRNGEQARLQPPDPMDIGPELRALGWLNQPTDLVTVDSGGDGDLDLVLAEGGKQGALVLANDGQGKFASGATLALGTTPGDLTVADLDGDGRDDLAIGLRLAKEVAIALGAGKEGFSGLAFIATGRTTPSVLAGDLDGDSDADLVAGNSGSHTLSLLFNAGHGDLTAIQELSAGVQNSLAALADLEGDADLDIIETAGDRLVFRRNDVNGRFPVRGLAGEDALAVGSPSTLVTGDWEGDRRADLAGFPAPAGGVVVLLNITPGPRAGDCNDNQVPDSCDLESGLLEDRDGNGVPDSCEVRRPLFHRGDPNGSGKADISDGIHVLGYLFAGDSPPACKESADVNNDAALDIADPVYLLNWLFAAGSEPPAPGPPGSPCGRDPDPSGSPGDLGCEEYARC